MERPATGEHLGRAVLSRIEAARASLPPMVLLAHEHAGNQREAAALWERFCASVVGVPVSRYRPECTLHQFLPADAADQQGGSITCTLGAPGPAKFPVSACHGHETLATCLAHYGRPRR